MVNLEEWQHMTPKQQWDTYTAAARALIALREQVAAPPLDEPQAGAPKARRGDKPADAPAE